MYSKREKRARCEVRRDGGRRGREQRLDEETMKENINEGRAEKI